MASSDLSIKVSVGQFCDAGRKEVNEDCLGVQIPDEETLLLKGLAAVVADGVSAASFGKEAAEMCVQSFLLDYFSTPDSWSVKKSCQKVINGLNRWLYGQSQSVVSDSEKGYVSTMSAIVLHSCSATIFHIGDTRISRIRDGKVEQLTRDHNSKVSSDVTYLSRAMGLNLNPKVDYREIELESDDLFLITSDGLHEFVRDSDIIESLKFESLDESAGDLAEKALANGSGDNLTALFVRVDHLPKASHEEMKKFLLERPFPPVLYPGNIVDGLEVEKVLFESSRSQLYRVKDMESGLNYAMKTPSSNFSDDPAYIERFGIEEWIGKLVDSPHLVKVLERSTKPRFLYYLMEEISGKNLQQVMNDMGGKIPLDEAVEYLKQAVKGVRALHRKEAIHQDLKPDNIMLCDDGVVKIIDYGACGVASITAREVAHERESIVGTIEYSAPEYRLGDKGSTKSDQFSLGMILYKVLSGGKNPYGSSWLKAKTLADFEKLQYTPVTEYTPDIPKWVDGAMAIALNIKSDKRYETLSEFVVELEKPSQKNMKSIRHLSTSSDPAFPWKVLSAALLVITIILVVLLVQK